MKTTRTTVFLSLAILASFLFVSSVAFADATYYDNRSPSIDPAGEYNTDSNLTFEVSGSDPFEFSGTISGSGNFTKTGGGELVISGDSSEFTGLFTVNQGTVTLDGDGAMKGAVTINGESIFNCGVVTPGFSKLKVNSGSAKFAVGSTTDTSEVYLTDFTLSNGFIEFDINEYDPEAGDYDMDKDYLYVGNGTLTSGAINLKFHGENNNESIWHDAYPEGIPLIIASQNLVFEEGTIDVFSEGQKSNIWTLVKDPNGKYIYLKPTNDQPDPPTVEKWYYANKDSDIGLDSWTMNNNPKIGVKFLDGADTAEFGSADNPKTIAMNKNGSFTQGEYQIGEGKKLTINATISGDADLLKTGKGELLLNGNNTYTGETIVKQGTLTLLTAGATGTLKPGSTITVDGSTDGTATLNGHGDIFGWTTGAPSKIILKNGGILQQDGSGNNTHTTMGAIIEMNNGIIQTKNAEATGSSGVGSYIMDNAIHVIGGQNNAINLNEFSIRHLDGTRYAEGEDAGYFVIAEGAKLTINAKMDSYGGVTNLPIVKTGKGELELTKRNENIKSDFIIKEGTVIGNSPNNGSSTFGYGTLIIEDGALLDCHDYNQFGYGDNVQPNIVVRGTLIPYTDTHMHNVTLESGTIESENGSGGIGLDFYNRTGTITSSGTSVIKSQLSRGGNITFNVTDGELTISGNNNITAPMTKIGAGTLKLTNANGSTGAYTIQEGVVVAGNEIALGTGAVTITGDATTNAVGQLTIGESAAAPLNLTLQGTTTLNGGQINFDLLSASSFDTLSAVNFTFTTGAFNLTFAEGAEAAMFTSASDTGYQLVSISGTYSGAEDLTSYLSGANLPWALTAENGGIYLRKTDNDPYWHPIRDEGQDWSIDNNPKVGVKFNDEYDYAETTASHEENIILAQDGEFIIGDGYELDQVGPITDDGDLTKTGDGTLVLSGDNTYTGDTIVSDGTLKLNKDDAIASSGNVTNNATIESTGDQTFNNLSGTNPEAEINANNGTLTLNNGEEVNTRYDGTINGTAKVKKTGLGSLLFTGENTYEGGTEIDAGSLVLLTDDDSDGTAGVGPIEIGQNGELVYDVAAGKTKEIENKITGAGTITKTGAGKLQAHPTSDMPLQAGSFNVNQGQFDLLGDFTGDLNVGPLDENGNEVAKFSPGNSVGDATVYGDVNINAKATGLFEFDSYSSMLYDTLTVENGTFTISEQAAIELKFLAGDGDAYNWARDEIGEYQLVFDSNFSVIPGFDYNKLLSGYEGMFELVGRDGQGLFLLGLNPDAPHVPEPSTWALLLLGVAGLCWMRRRK